MEGFSDGCHTDFSQMSICIKISARSLLKQAAPPVAQISLPLLSIAIFMIDSSGTPSLPGSRSSFDVAVGESVDFGNSGSSGASGGVTGPCLHSGQEIPGEVQDQTPKGEVLSHAQILEDGRVEYAYLAKHQGQARKLAIELGSPFLSEGAVCLSG